MTDDDLPNFISDHYANLDEFIYASLLKIVSKRYWDSVEGKEEEYKILFGDPEAPNPPQGILNFNRRN